MSGYTPKKKAVIIGINYIETEGISLRGCANDAKLMALTLISHFDFNASDIIFLTDSEPDRGYDTLVDSQEPSLFYDNWPRDEVPPVKHHDSRIYPNKRNILTAINWLTRNAEAGDVLVFYFAGHGVQVDVLTSYEGEGYDEALLPADSTLYLASNGSDLDEYNVLLCSELKELLLCVPPETQLNVILDCNGGQTILDPAGNLSGMWYVKGIVTKGIWPFLSATNKVKRAHYNSQVFRDEQMAHRLVRPRYVPCVQVGNTQNLKDPSLQSTQYVSLSCKGYCFSAAPWSQIAAEASLPLLSVTRKTQVTDSSVGIGGSGTLLPSDSNLALISSNTPSLSGGSSGSLSHTTESKLGVIEIPISRGGAYNIIHGVFTWSLCKAISDIATGILQQGRPRNELSFKTILARVKEYISCLRASILPHLDQNPEITIHSGGAGTVSEYFCSPFGGDKSVDFDFDHYFRITDNCIRHLRRNQNFLIPQEAYNSMLRASKNDNLVFHSVNVSAFPKPPALSCQSPNNGSPPTFREKEDSLDTENKADETNRQVPVPRAGAQFPPSNQVAPRLDDHGPGWSHRPFDSGLEEGVSIPELSASSVNLVPPTASLFFSTSGMGENRLPVSHGLESENHRLPRDLNHNLMTPVPASHYLFSQSKPPPGRGESGKVGEQKAIGFNTFNPYSMFFGPEPSLSSSNMRNDEYLGFAAVPLEQRFDQNPASTHGGLMLSNPIRGGVVSSRGVPGRGAIQPQSHQHPVGTNLRQTSTSQGRHPTAPPTLPISSYRTPGPPHTPASQLFTYHPPHPPGTAVMMMHSVDTGNSYQQSLQNHLVAPIRPLPNSNKFYHQPPPLSNNDHRLAAGQDHLLPSSDYVQMSQANFAISDQLLQPPGGLHNNQFPLSNPRNGSFYPRSFITYPPPTQPIGHFGANM